MAKDNRSGEDALETVDYEHEHFDPSGERSAATFRIPHSLLERARDITASTDYSLNEIAIMGIEHSVSEALKAYKKKYGTVVPRRRTRTLK